MANEVNKVGMGVYVDDGATTLATLRAIRQEMEAIARLSGRTPPGGGGGTGGSQSRSMWEDELKAREAAELASIRRIAKARSDVARGVGSDDEINILARQKALKADQARRVNEEVSKIQDKGRQEEARKDERHLNESLRRREAQLQRIKNYAKQFSAGTLDPTDIFQNARLLQSRRNDPAAKGDKLTNIFRQQIAEYRAGYRMFQQEMSKIESDAARQAQSRSTQYSMGQRFADNLARKQDWEFTKRIQDATRAGSFDAQRQARAARAGAFGQINSNRIGTALQAQMDRDYTFNRQQTIAQARIFRQAGLPVPPSMAQQLYGPGFNPSNTGTLNLAAQSLSPGTRANAGQMTGFTGYPRGYPAPPLTGRGGIIGSTPISNFGQIKGAGSNAMGGLRSVLGTDFNLGVAGRITRNILLYEAVSSASYGLVRYIGNAVTAAKTTVEFANALRFATEQADANLAQNEALANSFVPIGLSRQQGRAAVVEATRFAEDRPNDINNLTTIVADIAAARGVGIDRTDELIEQLRRRESKFYKRVFGTTVETIYENEARANLTSGRVNIATTPELFIGLENNEIKSLDEQVGSYVAKMDDAAKENAVLNYILAQGNRFQGEAAERAQTLAGRLDRLAAAWLNSQEGLGLFITDLRVVNNLLEGLANRAGVLDTLRPPDIGRTGPRGSITNEDVRAYGVARTTGTRASLLNAIDTYGLPVAGAAVGAGFLGLLGRRDSLIQRQNSTYYNVLNDRARVYGYNNFDVAATEARMLASQQRASIGGSVMAGAARSTIGFTNTIGGLFGYGNLLGQRSTPRIRYGTDGAQGPYSPLIDPRLQAKSDRIQAGVGATGGIIGGAVGAGVGSFIADKMQVGTLTAAGLTILGGAAGNAVGSFIGDAAGGALGASLATAGGTSALLTGSVASAGALVATAGVAASAVVGVGLGMIIEPVVSRVFGLPAYQQRLDDAALAAVEAAQPAFLKQTTEFNSARDQGRLRFRSNLAGGPTSILTPSEVRDLVASGQGTLGDYSQEFISRRESRNMTQDQYRARLRELANPFGVSLDSMVGTRINGTATGTGISSQFSAMALQQAIGEQIAEKRADISYLQLVSPDDTEALKQANIELGRMVALQTEINDLAKAEENSRGPGAAWIDPEKRQQYRAERYERDKKRLQKEAREFLQDQTKLEQGLTKLRSFEEQSPQLVGSLAQQITGDNRYTQILADQITVAERMRREWGWLGEEAVSYFTKVEQAANNRKLTQAMYSTYVEASGFRNQARDERTARERALLEAGGIDRATGNRVSTFAAAGNFLNVFQEGRRGFADIFGRTRASRVYNQSFRPGDMINSELGELQALYGITSGRIPIPVTTQDLATGKTFTLDAGKGGLRRAAGINAASISGLSEAGQLAIRGQYAESFFSTIQGYTPAQIRQAGLEGEYLQAQGFRQAVAAKQLEDSVKKTVLDDQLQSDLDRQLAEDRQFRDKVLREGGDPREVGRLSDELVLSRTDNIDAKDLSYSVFEQRQEALKRQAERRESERTEAQKAVEETKAFQTGLLEEVKYLREALVNGDMKVLISIQNDTQARVDQEALEARQDRAAMDNQYLRRD
jgi:hypothetical protein